MAEREWYQVDNVANVFLATVTRRDTRSLRISCTLTEPVIPELLQEALEETLQQRPQFHVRIHRGFFWHYIEEATGKPVVLEEYRGVCPILQEKGKHDQLHFEVTYYKNRINFDLFHGISDGTGAIEFLNMMTLAYLKRVHPDELADTFINSGASADGLSENSYKHFYEDKTEAPKSSGPAYHPHGLKLPFDQLQFLEVHMPVDEILRRSRELGVSMTSYIGTRLMMALLQDMPAQQKNIPVTISMPVNLRNLYPSQSIRNFFNNVSVSHLPTGDETLETLAKEFDQQFRENLAPDKIRAHMNHYQKLQENRGLRAIPLFLKQPGLRLACWLDSKKVSAVLSNLGPMKIPPAMAQYIDLYSMFCSSENLFMTLCSYNGRLVIGITNPYLRTGVLKSFIRGFSAEDIPVRLYSTEVIR